MKNGEKLLVYPWFYSVHYHAKINGDDYEGKYVICSRRTFSGIHDFMTEIFKKSSYIDSFEIKHLSCTEKSTDYKGKRYCVWDELILQ